MSTVFSEFDKFGMRKVILNFPKQFSVGLEIAKDIKVVGDFNQLIFCGMGGSALPAEILKMLRGFYEWPIAIKIHKSYDLPSRISPGALVFTISYSGNTEETISSYEEAKKRNLAVVGIATGGKLAELCKKDKTPFVKIPKTGIQPRSALGYLFAAVIKILSNSNIIENIEKDILEMAKNLNPKKIEEQGQKFAKKIKNTIPIIYASDKFKELAQIWKINFNENSKSPAFWNYFPELNHNEMEGMSHATHPFYVLILKDDDDYPRIKKRMDVTAKLLKEKGLKVEIIKLLNNKNLLLKIFSNYVLSQWASYYLALEYNIDPTPVKMVEEFKKKLK